jgi:hypothetical protein
MKSPGLIHSNRAVFAWLAALLLLGFSAGAQDASAFVSYQRIISQTDPTMDWLDPEIEATANLYAVWRGVPQNPQGYDTELVFARSMDRGVNWTRQTLYTGDVTHVRIAAQEPEVHIVFEEDDCIKYLRSTNSGANWSSARTLYTATDCREPDVAVERGADFNNVYVVWTAPGLNDNADIWFKRSTDAGLTWISGAANITQPLSTNCQLQSKPRVQGWALTGQNNQHVYIVFEDINSNTQQISALFTSNYNAGTSAWTSPDTLWADPLNQCQAYYLSIWGTSTPLLVVRNGSAPAGPHERISLQAGQTWGGNNVLGLGNGGRPEVYKAASGSTQWGETVYIRDSNLFVSIGPGAEMCIGSAVGDGKSADVASYGVAGQYDVHVLCSSLAEQHQQIHYYSNRPPVIQVDGRGEEEEYGSSRSTQNTQTGFGNSDLGLPDFANGSEIDEAFGVVNRDALFLTLAGNLESNFNKLELFIDSAPGGQNRLLEHNPDVDFGALQRMGDNGSGNGLTFDYGFEPDYYLTLSGGDVGGGLYQLFVHWAELLTGGGGIGRYLGQTGAVSDGVLIGGDNPDLIRATIDNSNTAGVSGGFGRQSGRGVTTGVEMAIPLRAIGNPSGSVRICAFINGLGHEFLSNQFLGSLHPPCDNLGEPRVANLEQMVDDQFFEVSWEVAGIEAASAGGVPNQHVLYPNEPNPFNPATVIRYDLREGARVTLSVYDVAGRRIHRLVDDDWQNAGRHAVTWNGRSAGGEALASGVYFYRLEAGNVSEAKRMVMLK